MSSYSNSSQDRFPSESTRYRDEASVKGMYEAAPYPDLGADLKDLSLVLDPVLPELKSRPGVRFLDVGCGTGHNLVGVAKKNPTWDRYGVDLSAASLGIAEQLARLHNAPVQLHQGSYLNPLPFDGGAFDVISAMGTIHHCADPVAAMKALRHALKEDGWMLLHLYGQRADQGKFDLKEALNILEPDLADHQQRFEFFDALIRHNRHNWRKRLATTTLADVYGGVRSWWRNVVRRGRKQSWSPGWTARYDAPTAPWIDHFCHPCERAYEVPQIRDLLEASGFVVRHMIKQGREHPQLIPPDWHPRYNQLDNWDKWWLSELLAEGGGSFVMILQKA